MKQIISVKKEVDLKTLHVEAGVRYWEDASVNGVEDTENGNNIPCKRGSLWAPIINLDTGIITNWEEGKTASIHYKICDAGSYHIHDVDGNAVLSIENDYVPNMLSPGGDGYGDYIIMDIDKSGKIANWKFSLAGFDDDGQ